jgi:hypothetical protein
LVGHRAPRQLYSLTRGSCPDSALHPGYKSFFALPALMMVAVLADRHPPGLPDEMQ